MRYTNLLINIPCIFGKNHRTVTSTTKEGREGPVGRTILALKVRWGSAHLLRMAASIFLTHNGWKTKLAYHPMKDGGG